MSIDYVKIMLLFACYDFTCYHCVHGGIKTGTTAFDKESKTLDRIPLDYVRNELLFTCDNKFWRKGYSEAILWNM